MPRLDARDEHQQQQTKLIDKIQGWPMPSYRAGKIEGSRRMEYPQAPEQRRPQQHSCQNLANDPRLAQAHEKKSQQMSGGNEQQQQKKKGSEFRAGHGEWARRICA